MDQVVQDEQRVIYESGMAQYQAVLDHLVQKFRELRDALRKLVVSSIRTGKYWRPKHLRPRPPCLQRWLSGLRRMRKITSSLIGPRRLSIRL